ncbi:Rha family transcriptional regulator [Brucella sp. TWI559]
MTDHSYSTGLPGNLGAQNGNGIRMSSREIATLTKKRHPDVTRDIEKMLTELKEDVSKFAHIYQDSRNRDQTEYLLDRELTETLLLGYSALLRRKVIARMRELEEALHATQRPLTPAEMFLHSAQTMVAIEQRQAAQAAELQSVRDEMKIVSNAHVILDKMPTDCESIERIRERIGKTYGLSHAISTTVVRDTPYAPTVRVLVRNTHLDADGAHYSGYAKKEITAIFKRFVSECVQVTPTMCTHPYIEGRFRLVKGESK